MKRVLFSLILLPLLVTGCKPASTTTPPAALATGYNSPADQALGQSLAAVNYFVNSEKENYQCTQAALVAQTCLTPAQQAVEKPYLNSLIDATTIANAAYTAYHSGSQTLANAQAAYNTAQSAQTALTANKGVK